MRLWRAYEARHAGVLKKKTDFDLSREKPTVLRSKRPPSSCRAFDPHFEVHCQVNCSFGLNLSAQVSRQTKLNLDMYSLGPRRFPRFRCSNVSTMHVSEDFLILVLYRYFLFLLVKASTHFRPANLLILVMNIKALESVHMIF